MLRGYAFWELLHLGLLPLRGTAGDMLSCISQSYKSWSLGYGIYILVGGFKHEFYFPFHIWDVMMSSFPLKNSYFSRWLKPPTSIDVPFAQAENLKTKRDHKGWIFNVTPRILMILLTSCCCSIRAKSAWSLNSTRPVWLASASPWNLANKYLQKHRFFAKKTPSICDPKLFVPHRSPQKSAWGTAPMEEQLTNSETKEAELSMELWQMCGTKGSWVKIGQVIPESPDSMGISWNFRILKWRYCTI